MGPSDKAEAGPSDKAEAGPSDKAEAGPSDEAEAGPSSPCFPHSAHSPRSPCFPHSAHSASRPRCREPRAQRTRTLPLRERGAQCTLNTPFSLHYAPSSPQAASRAACHSRSAQPQLASGHDPNSLPGHDPSSPPGHDPRSPPSTPRSPHMPHPVGRSRPLAGSPLTLIPPPSASSHAPTAPTGPFAPQPTRHDACPAQSRPRPATRAAGTVPDAARHDPSARV